MLPFPWHSFCNSNGHLTYALYEREELIWQDALGHSLALPVAPLLLTAMSLIHASAPSLYSASVEDYPFFLSNQIMGFHMQKQHKGRSVGLRINFDHLVIFKVQISLEVQKRLAFWLHRNAAVVAENHAFDIAHSISPPLSLGHGSGSFPLRVRMIVIMVQVCQVPPIHRLAHDSDCTMSHFASSHSHNVCCQ